MDITEVRVKLVPRGHDKLRAFCSITIGNNFVIRDLKVIAGSKGAFVAMPSRKLTNRCSHCGGKNHHRASYCNDCGHRLLEDKVPQALSGRQKLHADIAHPINSNCRSMIQKCVLDVYQEEVTRAQDPSYQPMDLDVFEQDFLNDADVAARQELTEACRANAEGPGESSEVAASAGAEADGMQEEHGQRRFGSRPARSGELAASDETEWDAAARQAIESPGGSSGARQDHGAHKLGSSLERSSSEDERSPEKGAERSAADVGGNLDDPRAKRPRIREVRPPQNRWSGRGASRQGEGRLSRSDRDHYLSSDSGTAPSGRRGDAVRESGSSEPRREGRRKEPSFTEDRDQEPEDNFGAGLFS